MTRTALAAWLRLIYRGHRAAGKSATEARALALAEFNAPPAF